MRACNLAVKDISNLRNIVYLGDSQIDIDCAYNIASKYQNSVLKTIKFKEEPNIKEVTK